MTARTVLVTGGARGIGKGIAKSFLEAGHRMMIADLPEGGDWRYRLGSDGEMADTVDEPGGFGEVRCTPVDVTEAASCEQAVQATVDAFGGLDVLINNAGVIDSGPIEQFGEAQWDRIFAVNVKGVFLMTRAGGGESEGIRGRRHRQHGVHRRHRPIDTVPGSGLAARLSAQGRAPLRVSEAPVYAVRRARRPPNEEAPVACSLSASSVKARQSRPGVSLALYAGFASGPGHARPLTSKGVGATVRVLRWAGNAK